jgi:murein DD-endopeptidase MepM/ murein hydrolase activator NlpD
VTSRRRRGLWLAGAGVIAFLVLRRRASSPELEQWGEGWVFPVPDLRLETDTGITTYFAEASQEFKTEHHGLDVMYPRKGDADRARFPAGVVDQLGAKQHARFFAPASTPIIAAKDGIVWSVATTPHGIAVVLDHGRPWATFYQHLATTTLRNPTSSGKPAQRVKAGEVIGTMGFSPLDGERLRHLHFETWFTGSGESVPQDPRPVLDRFARQTWRT